VTGEGLAAAVSRYCKTLAVARKESMGESPTYTDAVSAVMVRGALMPCLVTREPRQAHPTESA